LRGGGNDQAPALKGDQFMENWREDNLESLYRKMWRTMPRRTNLRLSDREYFDIVTYILKANDFPTGSTELTSDMLSNIWIERKDGPKPLPNYSRLRVVGCLTQNNNGWILTMASQPNRLRATDDFTSDELKDAETKPLGTMTVPLQNFGMLGDFKPEDHKGHKMVAQGTLIRQGNVDRLSLTHLAMVSASCGQ